MSCSAPLRHRRANDPSSGPKLIGITGRRALARVSEKSAYNAPFAMIATMTDKLQRLPDMVPALNKFVPNNSEHGVLVRIDALTAPAQRVMFSLECSRQHVFVKDLINRHDPLLFFRSIR